MSDLHHPQHPVRFVTASSLFDGHDASINIMRRILQSQGAEVIHLGHNRSVQEVVDACVEEDVQGVAVSSYQGGHVEYFEYLVESLRERGAGHVKVYGGGGGVIVHDEIERLRASGVTIFSPEDGQKMGLVGMINSMIRDCDLDLWAQQQVTADAVLSGDRLAVARAITGAEAGALTEEFRATLETAPDGATAAGLLYTAPTLGSTAAERFFALSIAGARKTLYITNSYFAPDRNFINLLIAAARRGVDVRILTAGPRTDVNVVRLAGRAWYDTLLAAGVRVYEWQPTTLHAKTFVVDGEWFTVGSMNFDNRSMALNDEATLMVLDRTGGEEMTRVFLADLTHAREIARDVFDRRSWLQRIAEWSASTVTRLL